MTHQEQLEIGAYLLGALPPRERSAFEAHLAQCSACRNEVADLAGIPALLGKVSLAEVITASADTGSGLPSPEIPPDPGPEPSPGREPFPAPGPAPGRSEPVRPVVRLPDAGTADLGGLAPGVVRLPDPGTADLGGFAPATPRPATPRPATPLPATPLPSAARPATRPAAARPAPKPITAGPFSWRHRTVLVAAAAVVAILAVVGSVALISGRHSPGVAAPATAAPAPAPAPALPGETRTVSLLPAVAGVHGSVQIAGNGLGSLLRLSMGGVQPGQQCSLLVAGADGARESVASWTADYEGDVQKLADSALQPANIRWIGVATPDGTVLLQARLAA